ncbi:hypothetical protein pb186bvf_015792 [Paramecium bursaria]
MQARINQLSQLNPDKRIHNYAFNTQAIIGRGAYGVVYVGRNTETGQLVALKAVPIQSFAVDQQALLNKEIDIMKDLDCPNIVKLLDVLTTTNNCYIVSELCTGGDLREFMKRAGAIEEQIAIKILTQILRGILQSFKRGIIHRDLKPANILIAQNQIFKIADFGFAKRFDKLEDDLMTSLVGTPLYMSPQVLLRRQYTSKCDVWSIGLILYELIEGKTPWVVRDILDLVNKQRNQKIQFTKKLTKTAQQFIMGCLAYEENNRFGWEQVFTHPLFENAFDKKQETSSTPQTTNNKSDTQPNKSDTIKPNKSQTMILTANVSPSDNRIKKQYQQTQTLSPLQVNNGDRKINPNTTKLLVKTGSSPNDEENKKQQIKPIVCTTQPNTQKKDRTISVVHQKAESSSQTTRYSDNKLYNKDENYKSERGKQQEPRFLFQRQLSENDEFSQNRTIIQLQIEYLNFLKRLRHQLLDLYGTNQSQTVSVQKLSIILLKNAMIKSTDIKVNLFDKNINCLDLKDFERFRLTDTFRNLEKQILEIHFETFNQFQESCLILNENLNLIMQDQEFLEIFNNNFEFSVLFARLSSNLSIYFIKNFLYDQVLECANIKVVNFTYQMCLYVKHVQSLSFSSYEVQMLMGNLRVIKENFQQNRIECLGLIDKLVFKQN